MSHTPLVSVVMTAYNSGKHIRRAVQSILNQTYYNIEVLIVDDGSTDDTGRILDNLTDLRVSVFKNGINKGILYSRNFLLSKVSGKYVAVMDSDDIAMPDRIERQVSFLESRPDFGMCGTYFKVIDDNDKVLYNTKFPTANDDIRTFLLIGNCFCHSTVMMRFDLIKEDGYPNNYPLCEDFKLWKILSKKTKIANLPFYSTLYRIHAENVSNSRKADMFAHMKIINIENLNELGVEFTERELDIHSHMVYFDSEFFLDPDNFNALNSWITKLFSAIVSNKIDRPFIISSFILRRWLIISYKTKHYNNLINFKLFVKNKAFYLRFLSEKLIESLSNSK
jgi:glycosyltransferase involved in cell wall biosynthesis